MINKKQIKIMVMDVKYEEGEETEKVEMEETGRVKEDEEYFLRKPFHKLKTKGMIFRFFFSPCLV